MVHIGNSWDDILADEFKKEYYLKLREFLKYEYSHFTVYPDMHDIFNSLKYTPYEKVKAENGDVLDKVIYMPIVDLNNPDAEAFIEGYRQMKPVAMECCFSEVTPEVLRLLQKVKDNGSKIWLNGLWPSLNGGHDDDRAVELNQKDESWGWLLEKGASLIQTDRPVQLLQYLKEEGRRWER